MIIWSHVRKCEHFVDSKMDRLNLYDVNISNTMACLIMIYCMDFETFCYNKWKLKFKNIYLKPYLIKTLLFYVLCCGFEMEYFII